MNWEDRVPPVHGDGSGPPSTEVQSRDPRDRIRSTCVYGVQVTDGAQTRLGECSHSVHGLTVRVVLQKHGRPTGPRSKKGKWRGMQHKQLYPFFGVSFDAAKGKKRVEHICVLRIAYSEN